MFRKYVYFFTRWISPILGLHEVDQYYGQPRPSWKTSHLAFGLLAFTIEHAWDSWEIQTIKMFSIVTSHQHSLVVTGQNLVVELRERTTAAFLQKPHKMLAKTMENNHLPWYCPCHPWRECRNLLLKHSDKTVFDRT